MSLKALLMSLFILALFSYVVPQGPISLFNTEGVARDASSTLRSVIDSASETFKPVIDSASETFKPVIDSVNETFKSVNDNPPYDYSKGQQVSQHMMAVLVLILGVILLIIGYRLFRVTLVVLGFTAPFVVLYGFLSTKTQLEWWASLLISIGVGIVSAFVVVYIYKVGLFILGAFAGVNLSVLIISNINYEGQYSDLVIYAIYAVMALACGVLLIFFERSLMICATSLIGANFIVSSVDIFTTHGQFVNRLTNALFRVAFFHSNSQEYPDWVPYVMLGCVVIITLFGISVQHFYTARPRDSKGVF